MIDEWIRQFLRDLRASADQLRAKMDAAAYKNADVGPIFVENARPQPRRATEQIVDYENDPGTGYTFTVEFADRRQGC